MDIAYLALVYISLLVYLGMPLFWLLRHYFYLNHNMHRLEFKVEFYLILIIFEAAVFFVLSPYVPSRQELPILAAPLGFLVLVLWGILEIWSLLLLAHSVQSMKKLETSLVKSGPYALVRHPIYLAHLLFNFGAYLVTGAIIPLMVLVEWLILIKPLADFEDEELALRFEEEFHEYKKGVPQLLPRIRLK